MRITSIGNSHDLHRLAMHFHSKIRGRHSVYWRTGMVDNSDWNQTAQAGSILRMRGGAAKKEDENSPANQPHRSTGTRILLQVQSKWVEPVTPFAVVLVQWTSRRKRCQRVSVRMCRTDSKIPYSVPATPVLS